MQECTNARMHQCTKGIRFGGFVHFCIGALVHCGCASPSPAAKPPPPNVLLVTIDTFRADRLTAGVAPVLDRLAATAVRFTAARSAVPLTLPSHATVLTGLMPPAHGVRENGIDALNGAHKTIATALKPAGYRTAAFIGAFVLDRRFGLAQGFDTYDDQIPRDPAATERLEAERPASAVVDRAIAWLDRSIPPVQPAQPVVPSPWFVWIHLYDPHAPYNPPPEFIRIPNPESRAPSPAQRYEGEIRYADAQIGRVFDWLRAHQAWDHTLLVVAGDHGEGLSEHGERTHGMLLYDSTLRVPLIVAAPKHAAAVRSDAVTLADIAPTILRAAGVSPPVEMKGRNLFQPVQMKPDLDDLYAETEYPRVAGWSPLQALTDGRWKTIRAAGGAEVYDLENDPSEQHDVAMAQANIAHAMVARLDAVRARASTATKEISGDAAERLRALGYVAGSTQSNAAAGGPNPSTMIASWNQFEDALSAVAAHHADAALPMLKTLAAAHPDAPVFQTTYAGALRDTGNVRGALDVYRRAAGKWATDPLLLHDLSVAARESAATTSGAAALRLRDEAARADRAALVIAPTTATAHNGLGLLAIDRDRPQDAIKEFEAAAAVDPNNASYWANLGNARRALRDESGAEQAYRRALDVDPHAADAANGLGVLLVEAQRPGEAIAWFERATTAAPDFVEAHLNLGIALQQSGQVTRAAEQYRRVLASSGAAREKAAAGKLLRALDGR
jgi:arylsulfatase A-like enzyme/Flp pilus assembly protein TadD